MPGRQLLEYNPEYVLDHNDEYGYLLSISNNYYYTTIHMYTLVNSKSVLLLWLITLSIIILYLFPPNEVFSLSPPFLRQVIKDDTDDWFLITSTDTVGIKTYDDKIFYPEEAKDISQCKESSGFHFPDIAEVSLISDGTTLNATYWLTSSIIEPPLKDTLDIYRESFYIGVIDLTYRNLSDYTNRILDALNNDSDLILSTPTTLGGNTAYMVEYITKDTDWQRENIVTSIWTINDNKFYILIYSIELTKYLDYLPTMQKMVDSFNFIRDPITSNLTRTDNFSNYESSDYGIRIEYPSGWEKKEIYDRNNLSNVIIFLSPFENFQEVSWQYQTYTMSVDIDSLYEPYAGASDYVANIEWSVPNQTWTETIAEVSSTDNQRVFYEKNNYSGFFDKGNNYAILSTSLGAFNYPNQYYVALAIKDTFMKNGRLCNLIDSTNWVAIPPPEFDILTSPGSLTLRPGETKYMELQIKAKTDLQSYAFFSAKQVDGIEINFIPNQTSVPRSSIATSQLEVKALENATPRPYVVSVSANTSSTDPVVMTANNQRINNSTAGGIIKNSNLTITVLPPFTIEEHLNNFYKSWLSPISGIWTFFAGIAAVIAPLIIRTYTNKKKQKTIHEDEH